MALVGTALIFMYGKTGQIDDARRVVYRMIFLRKRLYDLLDNDSWNSVITV